MVFKACGESVFNFMFVTVHIFKVAKKSLKIPKGQSESVNRRRTDNTMAKRKSTKGQTKHTHKKLKIE